MARNNTLRTLEELATNELIDRLSFTDGYRPEHTDSKKEKYPDDVTLENMSQDQYYKTVVTPIHLPRNADGSINRTFTVKDPENIQTHIEHNIPLDPEDIDLIIEGGPEYAEIYGIEHGGSIEDSSAYAERLVELGNPYPEETK